MSDQTEIPEPFSDEYLNHLSPYMKAMCTVENLIFDFNEEDIPQILEEISKIDDESQQIVYHLILYVFTVRPKQVRNLYLLWSQLKETNITFPVTDITYYLSQKGAKINLSSSVMNFTPSITNFEERYPINSIAHALMYDDFDLIVYHSSNDSFFDQKIQYNTEEKTTSLLNFAALYGSKNSFVYLHLNGCDFDHETPKMAICGGNEEIIEMCQQNGQSFLGTLSYCISYHRNSLIPWILDNFNDGTIISLDNCLSSHNTMAFSYFSSFLSYFNATPLSLDVALLTGNA